MYKRIVSTGTIRWNMINKKILHQPFCLSKTYTGGKFLEQLIANWDSWIWSHTKNKFQVQTVRFTAIWTFWSCHHKCQSINQSCYLRQYWIKYVYYGKNYQSNYYSRIGGRNSKSNIALSVKTLVQTYKPGFSLAFHFRLWVGSFLDMADLQQL